MACHDGYHEDCINFIFNNTNTQSNSDLLVIQTFLQAVHLHFISFLQLTYFQLSYVLAWYRGNPCHFKLLISVRSRVVGEMRSSKSYNDFNSRNRPQRQDYTQVARSQSHEVSNKKDELDKSTGSLRSVLSALSLSIKSWSKPGSSARNSTRRSPQEDVSELPEEIQDEHRLQRALHDAVRNTDGVGAVEVWILDRSHAQGAHLVQPAGGFWCSKYFMADDYEALARLVDKTRDDYVPPPPMMPGTGLAGVLWNEHRNTVSSHRGGKPLQSTLKSTFGFYATGRSPLSRLSMASSVSSSQSSSVKSFQSMTNLNADYRHSQHSQRSLDAGLGLRFLDNPNELVWRDITSVNVDPYMPTYPRLELMETAGLKKCAGIVFDIKGTSGIVLFLADERVKISRLNLPDNVAFMKASANYIGAAASLVKHRIRLNARINKRPRNIDTDGTNDQSGLIGSVATWLRKCAGGDLQPPPAMPLDETSLTFTGVFVTLLVLHRASSGIEKMTGSGVIFGPFGALMTRKYFQFYTLRIYYSSFLNNFEAELFVFLSCSTIWFDHGATSST